MNLFHHVDRYGRKQRIFIRVEDIQTIEVFVDYDDTENGSCVHLRGGRMWRLAESAEDVLQAVHPTLRQPGGDQ